MPVPAIFDRLRLPVIGAPLFIVSNPDLVIAQCKAGIVGSFPALNARPVPVSTTALTRSSVPALRIADSISFSIPYVIAFIFSGRLSRISPIEPSTVYSKSAKVSPPDVRRET